MLRRLSAIALGIAALVFITPVTARADVIAEPQTSFRDLWLVLGLVAAAVIVTIIFSHLKSKRKKK